MGHFCLLSEAFAAFFIAVPVNPVQTGSSPPNQLAYWSLEGAAAAGAAQEQMPALRSCGIYNVVSAQR